MSHIYMYVIVYLCMYVCMCVWVGVFIYACICIYMYIICIHIFPFLSYLQMEQLEQLSIVVRKSIVYLRDYQIYKKKLVFMSSYPKTTKGLMVVRSKWNFYPNLWFSLTSACRSDFILGNHKRIHVRSSWEMAEHHFLAGRVSVHIKDQG